MLKSIHLKWSFLMLLVLMTISLPMASQADESLALYGLKGYAFTFSPLPSNGFYLQAGGMYAVYDDPDGYIGSIPVSFTYGDGKWWEISASSHWEYWENKDVNDLNETGIGDLFLGGKIRFLGTEKNMPLDLAIMPYVLIPTGTRDKGIGDLYGFNPSPEDDFSYGFNLLLGRQIESFYLSANLGVNFVETDVEWIDSSSFFIGLALEYQINESWNSYVEFFNVDSKRDFDCQPCLNQDADEDNREIGAGLVWIWGRWGFKAHAGAGLTDLSPNFRGFVLVNRNF